MADYNIRLSCPVCAHIAAAPVDNPRQLLLFRCGVCRTEFELNRPSVKLALDLIDIAAITKRTESVDHCGECGSVLFQRKTEVVNE